MQVASRLCRFRSSRVWFMGGQLSVYMTTREEMEERQRMVAQRPMLSYL